MNWYPIVIGTLLVVGFIVLALLNGTGSCA